ncbi:MAG: hypothetical protein Q7S77_00345 [Candidatus Staskawiczbacteria bacterium]|nr:hypothetical protein [Candidatus Staskawiczbacteria bacterium]
MANSKGWCRSWGKFVAGDIVNCLVFREEDGKMVERILKMRVSSERFGKIPAGHAAVRYCNEDGEKKSKLVHPVPIDNLSPLY